MSKKLAMITKLQMDSVLGYFGLKHVLKEIVEHIPDPIERDVMEAFIRETTEKLSDADVDALTDLVCNSLVDFDVIEESPHDQDLKGYVFDNEGMHNGYVMLSLKDLDSLAKFLTQNDQRKMVTDLLDLPVVATLDYPMGNILDYFGEGYKELRAPLIPYVLKYQQSNLEEPEEFPYLVSVLDEDNNPSDNLDNFALKEDAIDYAKNNPGTGVFLERYIEEKNICEYELIWHPCGDCAEYPDCKKDMKKCSYSEACSVDCQLKSRAKDLFKILVDNNIDDIYVIAEAIWDIFISTPFPTDVEPEDSNE